MVHWTRNDRTRASPKPTRTMRVGRTIWTTYPMKPSRATKAGAVDHWRAKPTRIATGPPVDWRAGATRPRPIMAVSRLRKSRRAAEEEDGYEDDGCGQGAIGLQRASAKPLFCQGPSVGVNHLEELR